MSTESASISVVIPMRNSSRTIVRALKSVERQTIPPMEIIVVDNNSDDNSVEVVSSAAISLEVRVVSCAQPGSGAARNEGIRRARGTHIAFLDADDVWYPKKLAEQLELVSAGARLVGTYFDYLRADGTVIGDSTRLIGGQDPATVLRSAGAMPAPMSSLIVERRLIEESGPMDVSFMRAQDFEWLVRLAQTADLMMAGMRPLVGYVMSENSASATAYVEQALAAALVRSRRQGGTAGDYQSAVLDPLASGRVPRRIVAAHHYRQAGVALANRQRRQFVLELFHSVRLAPIDVIKKLRSQSVKAPSGRAESPVADLFHRASR